MNRAERRAAERDRRRWLAALERSDLPEDTKTVARALAELSADDGTVTLERDDGDDS